MVNIYIRFITFLLLIFIILVVNTSSSNTDKQHDVKDGQSDETKMSDKMIEERIEKKSKKICKKCTKSKYQESHKEVCSQCKFKKDSGKGDCNKCVRTKFRERNDFCSSCPAVVVESKKKKSPKNQRNNANKKNAKSPSTKVAPSVYQPIPSTGTAATKDVELGPWGTLLKEIIQANTFIDDK